MSRGNLVPVAYKHPINTFNDRQEKLKGPVTYHALHMCTE